MPSYRGGRINEEVRKEISVLIRDEIKDARLTAMISVTAVKVTKDLRYAKVYVSIFAKNEEEKKENLEALKSAAGFVRREIAQRINLRYSPQILFEIDDSIDYGMKIDSLIEQTKRK